MAWGINVVGYATAVDALRSIQFDASDGAVKVVGPTVSYAVYHELGTSKMEARPFAQPAAERVQKNLESVVGEFLDVSIAEADQAALTNAAALAVKREMQDIIKDKDIWDTGSMHASVSIAEL